VAGVPVLPLSDLAQVRTAREPLTACAVVGSVGLVGSTHRSGRAGVLGRAVPPPTGPAARPSPAALGRDLQVFCGTPLPSPLVVIGKSWGSFLFDVAVLRS